MQNPTTHLNVLNHAVYVLDEIEHYVLSNDTTIDAFLKMLATEGFSLQGMIDFQQQRLSQFERMLTAINSFPNVASRQQVNHVHE